MDSNPPITAIWHSGRLAPHLLDSPRASRGTWLGAGLLTLSAVVLALFVAVLEHDVERGALQQEALHARAVAEVQCEADQPAQARGRCLALLNGDDVAAPLPSGATPENTAVADEDAARAMPVSADSAVTVQR